MIGFVSKEDWVEKITNISKIKLTPREVLDLFENHGETAERLYQACAGKLSLLTLSGNQFTVFIFETGGVFDGDIDEVARNIGDELSFPDFNEDFVLYFELSSKHFTGARVFGINKIESGDQKQAMGEIKQILAEIRRAQTLINSFPDDLELRGTTYWVPKYLCFGGCLYHVYNGLDFFHFGVEDAFKYILLRFAHPSLFARGNERGPAGIHELGELIPAEAVNLNVYPAGEKLAVDVTIEMMLNPEFKMNQVKADIISAACKELSTPCPRIQLERY